jgi:IS5 family transposase
MKTDGRLARCPLKGTRGDAIFAVLCGCGHNLRKILNHIRKLLAVLLAMIARALSATEVIRTENHHSPQSAAA